MSVDRRMTTPTMDRAEPFAGRARLPTMQTLRRLAGSLAIVVLVAACAATAAPTGSPAPSNLSTVDPNEPVGTDALPGGDDPGNGPLTVPKPGQLEPRPVRMDQLTVEVTARHVLVTTTWTSGVEPCSVLDHIVVVKGDLSFTITLFEGHGPGNDVCIEIAKIKQAQVDLGELAPGTYTIADGAGGAAPIEVTVT
jgi:hypothetical protein